MPKGKKSKSKSSRSSVSLTKTKNIASKNPEPVVQMAQEEVMNSKMSPLMLFILVVIYGIAITINYLALTWLWKLEEIDCKCSDNWMRHYIKYFLYAYFVMLAFTIVMNLYFFLSGESFKGSSIFVLISPVLLIFNMFGFANMIIALIYIDQLKKMNCECSEDVKREIYWYYNIIKASFMAFALLISIATIILLR